MENFFDWFKKHLLYHERPWLIMGKGPSYSTLSSFDTTEFYKVSLNHVIRDQKVEIAHIIDFDVAIDCAEQIDANANILVLPWRPHIENWVSIKTLDILINENEVLKKLNKQGRIKFYNLGSCIKPVDNSPVIPTNFFSSEAVVNLLTVAGVNKIRTIGVDGGNTYSVQFKDLNESTLLANGHQSFDLQFKSISKKIVFNNLDYAPLGMDVPAKILVHTVGTNYLQRKVLEYSIKINSTIPIDWIEVSNDTMEDSTEIITKSVSDSNTLHLRVTKKESYCDRLLIINGFLMIHADVKNCWMKDLSVTDSIQATPNDSLTTSPNTFCILLNPSKGNTPSTILTTSRLSFKDFFQSETNTIIISDPAALKPWESLHSQHVQEWTHELKQAIKSDFINLGNVKEVVKTGKVRPSLLIQMSRKTTSGKWKYILPFSDIFYRLSNRGSGLLSTMARHANKVMVRLLTDML